MIQAENELKTRQAAVDSRNFIYAQIAERMLPYHRRALAMLDEMQPDAPDFRERVARLNLLNAYIKRGTNLLLTGEGEELSLGEKMLFAGRSRSSLKSFGIVAAAVNASYSVGYQTAAYN